MQLFLHANVPSVRTFNLWTSSVTRLDCHPFKLLCEMRLMNEQDFHTQLSCIKADLWPKTGATYTHMSKDSIRQMFNFNTFTLPTIHFSLQPFSRPLSAKCHACCSRTRITGCRYNKHHSKSTLQINLPPFRDNSRCALNLDPKYSALLLNLIGKKRRFFFAGWCCLSCK